MKLMIAYDGSAQSDSIINDLYSAGLPAEADVLLVSILEGPSSTEFSRFDVVERARNAFRAPSLLGVVSHDILDAEDLRQKVSSAKKTIGQMFSDWTVDYRIISGIPVERFLAETILWSPDMILVGSHGRSMVGSFLLGSFSQEVASRARSSIRVSKNDSRDHKHKPKILMGFDSPDGANLILESVSKREWHDETDVRILYDPQPDLARFVDDLRLLGPEIVANAVTTSLSAELIDESKRWRADLICIADPFLNSELIAPVLSQTACSVEVIRRGRIS